MRNLILRSLVSTVCIVWAVAQAQAAPTFFVGSGTNALNDVPWQNSVGSFVESDLDSYANGSLLSSLTMGNVTVSISLPNVPASGAEIFAGSFGGGGGQYGTVFGKALLNRNAGRLDSEIKFTFSTPVLGFGAWIFDNSSGSADSFEMTANGFTSSVLDAVPGSTGHTVEGFLGVKDAAGISSVIFRNRSGLIAFEMDHFQMAPIPEPSTVALIGLGLAGWGLLRRKRWSLLS